MPSDTAKIKICKAKICFNGPILFPQTYRKKSVNDEADIIVCLFLFKLQNSVFTERCIYCKKDHINRRCFVCAADLFNLLHVLCMIYLNSCSVLRHVEEDCWINGVQKCLYTQQVVSFILFSEQNSHIVTGTVTHSSPLQDIQLEAFTTKKGERGFFLL